MFILGLIGSVFALATPQPHSDISFVHGPGGNRGAQMQTRPQQHMRTPTPMQAQPKGQYVAPPPRHPHSGDNLRGTNNGGWGDNRSYGVNNQRENNQLWGNNSRNDFSRGYPRNTSSDRGTSYSGSHYDQAPKQNYGGNNWGSSGSRYGNDLHPRQSSSGWSGNHWNGDSSSRQTNSVVRPSARNDGEVYNPNAWYFSPRYNIERSDGARQFIGNGAYIGPNQPGYYPGNSVIIHDPRVTMGGDNIFRRQF